MVHYSDLVTAHRSVACAGLELTVAAITKALKLLNDTFGCTGVIRKAWYKEGSYILVNIPYQDPQTTVDQGLILVELLIWLLHGKTWLHWQWLSVFYLSGRNVPIFRVFLICPDVVVSSWLPGSPPCQMFLRSPGKLRLHFDPLPTSVLYGRNGLWVDLEMTCPIGIHAVLDWTAHFPPCTTRCVFQEPFQRAW